MKKAVIGSFILAVLHSILFYGQELGISVLLFTLVVVFLIMQMLKQTNKIKNKKALLLSIPIILLSSTYLFFDNEFFNTLNFIVIPILTVIMITWSIFDKFKFQDLFRKTINLYIGSLEFLPKSVKIIKNAFKTNNSETKGQKFKLIGIGILCSLPILFVIIGLLASADGIFANIFAGVIKNLEIIFTSEFILNIILRIICIILITIYIICIVYNILEKGSSYNMLNSEEKEYKLNLNNTIVNTILTVINIVYLIFSLIQFTYLGGIANKLGYNLATYARQGFFQLMFITFINFVIIILTNINNKTNSSKYTKIMNICMCVFTIIIAISAFCRMRLYEKEYGYTFLRLMVYFILTTEIIMIIPTIKYILKGKINLLKTYFIIGTTMYIIANFANIDYVIAKNNVDRATKLTQVVVRPIDVDYLVDNLGINAVPQIIKLYENEEIKENNENYIKVNNYLYKKYQELKEDRNPQEFNISKTLIEKQLEKMNLEYINKYNYNYNYSKNINNEDNITIKGNNLPIEYVHFTNEKEGHAVCMGDPAMGTYAVVIYNTTDGGDTWNKITKDFFSVHYGTKFMFTDEKIGFMYEPQRAGTDNYPELNITKDGGANWEKITFKSDNILENNLIPTDLPKLENGILETKIYTLKNGQRTYYNFESYDNGITWKESKKDNIKL